jgi:hypothetical protein
MRKAAFLTAVLLVVLLFAAPISAQEWGSRIPAGQIGYTSPSVPLNANPPRPVNTWEDVEGLSGYAVSGAEHMFIRTGDGIQYTPIGILDWGTPLIVHGRNHYGLADDSDQLWWYVEVGGMWGWVKSTLVVLRGDLTNIPEVPIWGEIQRPRLLIGYDAFTIFSGSDMTRALCVVPGHLEYYIVGRNATWTMYQIEAWCGSQRVTGWISWESGAFRNPADLEIPVTG